MYRATRAERGRGSKRGGGREEGEGERSIVILHRAEIDRGTHSALVVRGVRTGEAAGSGRIFRAERWRYIRQPSVCL